MIIVILEPYDKNLTDSQSYLAFKAHSDGQITIFDMDRPGIQIFFSEESFRDWYPTAPEFEDEHDVLKFWK